MNDTIFALSSGAPPAAIAVIRISGPQARTALEMLAKTLPPPRRASLRTLRDRDGDTLDSAMVLWLPGPGTATGEDLVELHCHGGRAIVAAVQTALGTIAGLRRAEPGEFTRRAFANGRMDLAEAEGLADLLSAETELQRRNALSLAEGALSRHIERWREELLGVSSLVEAQLDFGDEDDVTPEPTWTARLDRLMDELRSWLARPSAELLRDGVRVLLAGPPNTGKSSLFNALVESDAAIVTPLAGTTRDVLTRPMAISGIPFVFIDTAGLREAGADVVERIGIDRAKSELDRADVVLWLGEEGAGPERCWEIEPRVDDPAHSTKVRPRHRVSAQIGTGMPALIDDLVMAARTLLPKPSEIALNRRQHDHVARAGAALAGATAHVDALLVAEHLRQARIAMDQLLGRTGVEDMLDAVFTRFCIGR